MGRCRSKSRIGKWVERACKPGKNHCQSVFRSGQSHEHDLEVGLPFRTAPTGLTILLLAILPTLKRGANQRCASGAVESEITPVINLKK